MELTNIPDLIFFFFFPKEQNIPDQQNESSAVLKDQQVLNVRSYADLFSKSVKTLSLHLAEKADGEALIWDKVSLPFINSTHVIQLLVGLIHFPSKMILLRTKLSPYGNSFHM